MNWRVANTDRYQEWKLWHLAFFTIFIVACWQTTINKLILNTYSTPPKQISVDKSRKLGLLCREVLEVPPKLPKRSDDSRITDAIKSIGAMKRNKSYGSYRYYEVLSSMLPSFIAGSLEHFYLGDFKPINIIQSQGVDEKTWKLPYLPCSLRKYSEKDVRMCLQEKSKESANRFHILFLGDSRARHQMEAIVDLLPSLDFTITSAKPHVDYLRREPFNQLPSRNYSENEEGSGRLWRENGAADELERMLRSSDEELPHFVISSTGIWQLHFEDEILSNLDKFAVAGFLKLHRLLHELGQRTRVIHMVPDPFKDFLPFQSKDFGTYTTLENNGNLEWYLNAEFQMTPDSVLLWDSLLPVSFDAYNDCRRMLTLNSTAKPRNSFVRLQHSLLCNDAIHNGEAVSRVGAQLLLNHICNLYLPKIEGHKYCCGT